MPLSCGPGVEIKSRDYWFKVVEMLQQNWALIDRTEDGRAVVYFVHDDSYVFDRMSFESVDAAASALLYNGFSRFAADRDAYKIMAPPKPPFSHSNSPIYSSGRFWSTPPERNSSEVSAADLTVSVGELARAGALRVAIDPVRLPPPANSAVSWDRLEGMLLGLAIGDSLGNTSESKIPAHRRVLHGEIRDYLPNRHAENRRVGLPSDDTQLACWTLEHLLEYGRVEPRALAASFTTRQIFGMGSTVRSFLRSWRPESHWLAAGQESAGNGALMRIAPVLLRYARKPSVEIWRDAIVAGAITHNDFASNASCGAFVSSLARAVAATAPVSSGFWLSHFVEVASVLEGTVPRYTPRMPGQEHRLATLAGHTQEVVSNALCRDISAEEACNSWYSGAFLLETVPSVLYILERYGNDPEEAIVRAVNDTRDNDTAAAIVGAAVGALHGAAALPMRWRDALLGRTGANDDGRLYALLRAAKRKWWS